MGPEPAETHCEAGGGHLEKPAAALQNFPSPRSHV